MPKFGRNVALAAAAAGGGLAVATGFPSRIGVTKTDGALSLPGDLIFPAAKVIANQARAFGASPAQLWPGLFYVEEFFSGLWRRDLELVYEEPRQLLVWKTQGGGGGWQASCAAALIPGPDGTTVVRLRQRHAADTRAATFRAYAQTLATGAGVAGLWRRMRGALPS